MRECLISDLRFTEWGVRKKDETKFYYKSGVFTDEEQDEKEFAPIEEVSEDVIRFHFPYFFRKNSNL